MENLGLSILLAILALICGISYAYMTLTRKARLLGRFPCPGKFPIVGSIPYMYGPIDDAAIRFENLVKKFGRRVVIWLGPKPIAIVILAEADGAQYKDSWCGMKYALIQMKACLAHILRRFRVSTSQKREDISLLYGMVMEPKPKLEIMLTPK
ncbi:Cytochrome P450 4c3 [Folsomia candida]|uniref:Cytochrome P450 4c3 n=1 Tax=Folsomia candida TaxID=158441 RepID=A0A226EZN0_FOLCA|nr:Cytochrome P450 4c3 [Folsomia candida]